MLYQQNLIENHFSALFKTTRVTTARESQPTAPILFTDDEPAILNLYRLLMERENIPAIFTAHTQEAMLICKQEPISLVVSDIIHPVMSGFELLVAMRDDPRTEYIPLMFVSASGLYRDRYQMGYPLQAEAVMDKPFDHKRLLRKIHSLRLQLSAYQIA